MGLHILSVESKFARGVESFLSLQPLMVSHTFTRNGTTRSSKPSSEREGQEATPSGSFLRALPPAQAKMRSWISSL